MPAPEEPHEHEYVYHDDEYGSLADGGSYEVWRCVIKGCYARKYIPLPD